MYFILQKWNIEKKSKKGNGIDLDSIIEENEDEDNYEDKDVCINSACLRTSSLPYDDITSRLLFFSLFSYSMFFLYLE